MNSAPQFTLQNKVLPLLLGFFAVLCGTHAQAQTSRFADVVGDTTRVLDLIEQRLAIMPEVAAWKWRAQQPVLDAERERQVLQQSVAAAEAIGLDGASARDFFDVQVRMARAVQARCIERWRAENGTAVPAGRDLTTELRPELDAISRQLLTGVYLASAELQRTLQDQRVVARINRLQQYEGVDAALLSELRSALAALHIDGSATPARTKRVGVLRVGTTGDYAPFSDEHDHVLRGFDVNLAMRLAEHLGVSIQFVRTSWPTLMDDFKRHRFDIAMSGISVTAERSHDASFSTAYHVDGKTPIARCQDAAKFSTLARIDQPAVRVIANSGGTNERFVREHIRQAAIEIYADNQSIFNEILAGRADVMFTDGIEVDLQVQRHPDLCRTMSVPLTQAQKAIMLPSAEWQAMVNAWLAPQLQSGAIADQLQRALVDAR